MNGHQILIHVVNQEKSLLSKYIQYTTQGQYQILNLNDKWVLAMCVLDWKEMNRSIGQTFWHPEFYFCCLRSQNLFDAAIHHWFHTISRNQTYFCIDAKRNGLHRLISIFTIFKREPVEKKLSNGFLFSYSLNITKPSLAASVPHLIVNDHDFRTSAQAIRLAIMNTCLFTLKIKNAFFYQTYESFLQHKPQNTIWNPCCLLFHFDLCLTLLLKSFHSCLKMQWIHMWMWASHEWSSLNFYAHSVCQKSPENVLKTTLFPWLFGLKVS